MYCITLCDGWTLMHAIPPGGDVDNIFFVLLA